MNGAGRLNRQRSSCTARRQPQQPTPTSTSTVTLNITAASGINPEFFPIRASFFSAARLAAEAGAEFGLRQRATEIGEWLFATRQLCGRCSQLVSHRWVRERAWCLSCFATEPSPPALPR
jgi:hypothetical protein